MLRTLKPLRISSIPRSSLDSSQHGSVDAVLKDLKICSRRLNIALGAFRDEYQVLERLYYKGKNQHRVALFWRRVVEIRRFSNRLDRLLMDQTVDTLRSSFFSAEDAPSNPKMMKGPWTHFPEIPLVNSVLQRLSMCSALLEKMQAKLLDSYRSFNLAMQSGAFLQLILTLVAVASRLKVICEELQEVLRATQNMARRISEILYAPTILSKSSYLPNPEVVKDGVTGLDYQSPLTSQLESVEPSSLNLMDISVPKARIIVERSVKETEDMKDGEDSRKKKRQKPRDEIDDIFGF